MAQTPAQLYHGCARHVAIRTSGTSEDIAIIADPGAGGSEAGGSSDEQLTHLEQRFIANNRLTAKPRKRCLRRRHVTFQMAEVAISRRLREHDICKILYCNW